MAWRCIFLTDFLTPKLVYRVLNQLPFVLSIIDRRLTKRYRRNLSPETHALHFFLPEIILNMFFKKFLSSIKNTKLFPCQKYIQHFYCFLFSPVMQALTSIFILSSLLLGNLNSFKTGSIKAPASLNLPLSRILSLLYYHVFFLLLVLPLAVI